MADYSLMMSGSGWSLLTFYVLILFVSLVVLQEIFRRYPRFSLAFFSAALIIFFPCWVLLIGVEDWFIYMKAISVVGAIVIFSFFRLTKWKIAKWIQWTTYLVLSANILEASVKDLLAGSMTHYMNAIAGILLIATLNKIHTIHIDTKGKYKDLLWGSMTLAWIIGYTIWNWVFVYLNLTPGSGNHLAVLAAALVIVFVNKERWLQARAFTLGIYFFASHVFPIIESCPLITTYNEQVGFYLALASFVFMAVYTIFYIKRFVFRTKN